MILCNSGLVTQAGVSTTSCSFHDFLELENYRAFTKLLLCLFELQRPLQLLLPTSQPSEDMRVAAL